MNVNFKKIKIRKVLLAILQAVVFISSLYLFYLSYQYRDFLFVVFGILALLIGILTFLQAEILEKPLRLSVFPSIRGFIKTIKKPKRVHIKTVKAGYKSIIQKARYRALLILAVIYFVIQTIVSTYLIVKLLPTPQETDLFESIMFKYLLASWQELPALWVYEVLPTAFTLLLGIGILIYYNRKKAKIRNRINLLFKSSVVIISVLTLFILGAFSAILFSTQIASQEANLTISKIQSTPDLKSLGITTEKEKLSEKIKQMDKTPSIIGSSDALLQTIVLKISKGKLNRSEFYYAYILPQALKRKNLDFKLASDILLLPDNTLVIARLDKETIEAISPALGFLMIRSYFDPRYIKPEPKLQVMGRTEYLKYRDDQINSQLAEMDSDIREVKKAISAQYSAIEYDKQMIENNKSSLNNAIQSRDYYYNRCMTAGYYFWGYFYRYYSDAYCESQRREWDSIISGFEKNISDWENALAQDQRLLAEYQKAKELLETWREFIASQKERVPSELGIFEPPNTIKVVLESTSDKALADFFALVVHEYLHYSSYVSEERYLPLFFEEGLTEYLSRNVIANEIKKETNVGYPVIVKVVEEIAKDIPKEELENIYFIKDKNRLIALLNDKYGDTFYKDTEYYFSIIPWIPIEESLELANNIMLAIGGSQLSEEDI